MLNLKDIKTLDRVHIQSLADQWLHDALTNANAFTLRVGGERKRMDAADLEAQAATQERLAKLTREHIAAGQVEYLTNRAVQLMVQAGGMNVTDAEALKETDSFRLLCQELAKSSVKFYVTLSKSSRGDFEALDNAVKTLEASQKPHPADSTQSEQVTQPPRQTVFQIIRAARPSRAKTNIQATEGNSGEDRTNRKASSLKFPALSTAIETYIGVKVSKGEWGLASQKDIPPTLRQFSEILNELAGGKALTAKGLTVDALTRQHMRDYTLLLAALPYRTNGVKA